MFKLSVSTAMRNRIWEKNFVVVGTAEPENRRPVASGEQQCGGSVDEAAERLIQHWKGRATIWHTFRLQKHLNLQQKMKRKMKEGMRLKK